MDQPTDWMRGFMVREDIPGFAVNENRSEDGTIRHFLNFYLSKLREPDRSGNTHTIYCQEYDAESKRSVGDKIYIGKCKPVRSSGTATRSAAVPESGPTPGADFSDLPF